MYICKGCKKPCVKVWYDTSLGSVEYLGGKSFHKDGHWVSDCCEDDFLEVEDLDEYENRLL